MRSSNLASLSQQEECRAALSQNAYTESTVDNLTPGLPCSGPGPRRQNLERGAETHGKVRKNKPPLAKPENKKQRSLHRQHPGAGLGPVTKLVPGDIDRAAAVITEAFMDYPLPGQFIKDPARRRRALQEMFKLELRSAVKQGAVYTLGGEFQEVAIWKHAVKPESQLAYIWHLRLGTLKLLCNIRPAECINLLRALGKITRLKLELNLPTHAHELYIVGVNPANQGQGRLSRLLKPLLLEQEKQGRPVLVMTNTADNKIIYEHLGFKHVRTLDDKTIGFPAHYLVK